MSTATQPRERPLLFSAPMVRALLAGTKTQTRRAMKPQPMSVTGSGRRVYADADFKKSWGRDGYGDGLSDCRYGQPGDRLWVRETIAVHSKHCEGQGTGYFLHYRADDALRELDPDQRVTPVHDIYPHQRIADKGWRPSIHMPRWACRIVLEIADVRVQRLHEISEDDARAEGIGRDIDGAFLAPGLDGSTTHAPIPQSTARSAFALLWESINGTGSWDANPWTWALTFKRVLP